MATAKAVVVFEKEKVQVEADKCLALLAEVTAKEEEARRDLAQVKEGIDRRRGEMHGCTYIHTYIHKYRRNLL